MAENRICTICHRELPESAFYPTYLKEYKYQCKECVRKQNNQYRKEIKESPLKDFNRFYGGYSISILNFVREGEYRYSIKGTNNYFYQTNNVDNFMAELEKINSQYIV